jgi:hypothetical protein
MVTPVIRRQNLNLTLRGLLHPGRMSFTVALRGGAAHANSLLGYVALHCFRPQHTCCRRDSELPKKARKQLGNETHSYLISESLVSSSYWSLLRFFGKGTETLLQEVFESNEVGLHKVECTTVASWQHRWQLAWMLPPYLGYNKDCSAFACLFMLVKVQAFVR